MSEAQQINTVFTMDTAIPLHVLEKMHEIESLFSNEEATGAVKTQAQYDYLTDLLKKVKAGMKEIEKERSTLTSPLETEKKRIIAEFKPFQEKCADAEKQFKKSMGVYLAEQDRKRREEEARAEEKARKERARLEARAQKAAEKGHDEKAAELEAQAMATQAQPVTPAPEVTSGVSRRRRWKAEVTDKAAFIKSALANPSMMACIQIDEKKLNQLANALGEDFNFEGAIARPDVTIAIRA